MYIWVKTYIGCFNKCNSYLGPDAKRNENHRFKQSLNSIKIPNVTPTIAKVWKTMYLHVNTTYTAQIKTEGKPCLNAQM